MIPIVGVAPAWLENLKVGIDKSPNSIGDDILFLVRRSMVDEDMIVFLDITVSVLHNRYYEKNLKILIVIGIVGIVVGIIGDCHNIIVWPV